LFFKEEKVLEDLKDLGKGLNDLLDYGHDFIIANQLAGDKKEEKEDESFSEKIKREMKRGVDEVEDEL
jgi:hypothetical protein